MTIPPFSVTINNLLLCVCFLFFFCLQRSARCDQASVSRQRPWCWRAAIFHPPSCRHPAKGWACWRTLLAPWRNWETRGLSKTASKWLSSWAAAPPSPTARENGQASERKGLRDTVDRTSLTYKKIHSNIRGMHPAYSTFWLEIYHTDSF